jgi:hypothetical protein
VCADVDGIAFALRERRDVVAPGDRVTLRGSALGLFRPHTLRGHVLMGRLSPLGRSPRMSHFEASLLVPDAVSHW